MNSLDFADPRPLTLIFAAPSCNPWRLGRVFGAGWDRAFPALRWARHLRDRPSSARSSRTRSRRVVEVIWTWPWPSSPGRLPGAPGAACLIVAGDRDVVLDVDSTFISIMTEAVGVATRWCIWAGPLFRNGQRPSPLFLLISASKENESLFGNLIKISLQKEREMFLPLSPRWR